MDGFLSRKRRRDSPPSGRSHRDGPHDGEELSTDVKLALLLSVHPSRPQEDLLEVLLSCDGSVEDALEALEPADQATSPPPKRLSAGSRMQSALTFGTGHGTLKSSSRLLTQKGKTLHLYAPEDVANHTPCSLIHNFLPVELAAELLQELLAEAPSFSSIQFKIFDNVVKSPHTACFYVDSVEQLQRQKSEYYYNGNDLDDIREILPVMRKVSDLVRDAVNKEVAIRIRDFYPEGKKLKYQSPQDWHPNAAFVNCYDGGAQHVGYHADQLSYLGPRAIIGSLSLGVAREFRVRKIVPKDDEETGVNSKSASPTKTAPSAADISGQIAIHLPHNSLLVMHAEMQEEWKHSIAPAQVITPHPLAANKRINITYRWYREEFRPKYTPKCRCGQPGVLKCVMKRKETRGRYMWMCQVGNKPSGKGCGWFEWAKFTDDGVPVDYEKKKAEVEKEASTTRVEGEDLGH